MKSLCHLRNTNGAFMKRKNLSELEKTINYAFKDKTLLEKALTHKTFAYEAAEPLEYNERLELLGDSVLNLIVSEALYKSNKYFSEGELTRRRSILVNNKFLAQRAYTLDIGAFLRLGKGELKQNGSSNNKNLANALEALIGAVYLDSGLKKATQFIFSTIFTDDIKI
jgi:ribonuclease-3